MYLRVSSKGVYMELFTLIICGGLALGTSLMVVFARNTVHSALWMIASFFFTAVIFLLLRVQFIAILIIIVYAGAIMMFILYAIMLLNVRISDSAKSGMKISKITGVVLLLLLLPVLVLIGMDQVIPAVKGDVTLQVMEKFGQIPVLSRFLFSEYLLPFEVVSLLLTAGIIGAVFLAKRR